MIHKCSFYSATGHLFSKGGQGNINGNVGHGGGGDANDAAAQFLDDRATENSCLAGESSLKCPKNTKYT